MTHEDLEKLIDARNGGHLRDRIFAAPLSATVDFAKVWTKEPLGKAFNEGSLDFYFVKDDHAVWVAAVLDMVNDLHVYVKPEHRRQGHLTKAMTGTVLPWLHQAGRTVQQVTFQDSDVGDYCVRNWGFTRTGDLTAELDLSKYASVQAMKIGGSRFTHEDIADIRIKLNRAKLYLRMVKEKVEVAYGGAEDLSLELLMCDISRVDDEILDFLDERDPIFK